MNENPYVRLAKKLDALPNGFPATDNGAEIRLLAKLFTAEEAALAAQLRLTKETPAEIARRTGSDPEMLYRHLKAMARRGLIAWRRLEKGTGFGLLPFLVGIYEMQTANMDVELATLFEEYYRQAFGQTLSIKPQVHRVIPVGESVRIDTAIEPYESTVKIIDEAKAWGVVNCICRQQKALVGDPCAHPLEVCMILGNRPGAFDASPSIRALSKNQALEVLDTAAEAGLIHSVSNNQKGLSYICNCCTCSCGILRGIAEMGIANAVARSAFVNQVDPESCLACGDCVDACQFMALTVDDVAYVDRQRCLGCGVCVSYCPEAALSLVRRPPEEVFEPPVTEGQWGELRARARGIDLEAVL